MFGTAQAVSGNPYDNPFHEDPNQTESNAMSTQRAWDFRAGEVPDGTKVGALRDDLIVAVREWYKWGQMGASPRCCHPSPVDTRTSCAYLPTSPPVYISPHLTSCRYSPPPVHVPTCCRYPSHIIDTFRGQISLTLSEGDCDTYFRSLAAHANFSHTETAAPRLYWLGALPWRLKCTRHRRLPPARPCLGVTSTPSP